MESYLQCCVSTRDDNTEYRMLADKFMRDLNELLSTDWEKLGLELEVNSEKMKEIRSKCTPDVSCWAKQMLFKWTELFDDIQLVELIEGLENVRRNDLVQLVRETFPDITQLTECTQDLQKLFQTLATKLSTEWFSLGIELGVPSDDLDAIRIATEPAQTLQPAFLMLKFWNTEFTGRSRLEVLKAALRECRRNDLVRWIEQHQHNTDYVFMRQRLRSRISEGHELSGRFGSMQVSGSQRTLGNRADYVDQSCCDIEPTICQQYTCSAQSTYNSAVTNQRLVQQEGYDEVDNRGVLDSVGRTPDEHDENSSTSSQLTKKSAVRLDSYSEDGDKNIDIPGGSSVPKILTERTSVDSIRGEYSVDAESIAYSTTSC